MAVEATFPEVDTDNIQMCDAMRVPLLLTKPRNLAAQSFKTEIKRKSHGPSGRRRRGW